MSDLLPYRDNVGIVVFDHLGRVWLGRRVHAEGPHTWQFPQGGVDPGEDLETAARRELWEETGIVTVSLLGRAEEWIAYDFPADFQGSKKARGYRGQRQAWFAFRFEGEDAEVDLTAHPPQEFQAWRWAELPEAPDLVVPFKRDAYLQVIAAFAPYAKPR
ncbi:MAG TPA: RNA pyrophosphohydrolase [Caulobacteraceae bacterium]|nr:RNA pyrophosphohydrolase [Caulobacteraceae bacterium]